MEEYRPTAVDAVRQKTAEVYQKTRMTVVQRSAPLRQRTQALWAEYRPTTYLGAAAFAGIVLLAVSALCTMLNILISFLLMLSWIGVFVWAIVVSCSTGGAFLLGTANFFFSGTCAVMGTCILCSTGAAYAALYTYDRARAAGQGYYTSLQNKPGSSGFKALPPGSQSAAAASRVSNNDTSDHTALAAAVNGSKSVEVPASLNNLTAVR